MSSSSLESSKNLAGIGSILLIFTAVPAAGIVGIILLYIGLKGLSEYYRDDSIYRNALYGLLFGIIGIVAVSVSLVGLGIAGVFSAIASGGLFAILAVIVALIVAFVFLLIMASYFRSSFNALAEKSGQHLFRTAGTLLFWGAVLTIVFFIGLALIFIAWIIATIAFFSISVPTQPTQPYTSAPQPSGAPPPTQPTRFCPNCGSPATQDDTFCRHCGKQLPPP